MTIPVWAVVLVLLGHWLADFVWQPSWMGMGKSKSWLILGRHTYRIAVGGAATGGLIAAFAGETDNVAWRVAGWAMLNAVAHFGIDAVTSRTTGRLYREEKYHGFFTVIGFDQLLHVTFAMWTLAWIVL